MCPAWWQRGKAARGQFQEKRDAATKLEAVQRGSATRKDMKRRHTAATKVQAAQRGKVGRDAARSKMLDRLDTIPGAVRVDLAPGPTGMRIKTGAGAKGVLVTKVHPGGALEASGVVRPGMYLVRLGEVDLREKNMQAALRLFRTRSKQRKSLWFKPPTRLQTLTLAMEAFQNDPSAAAERIQRVWRGYKARAQARDA